MFLLVVKKFLLAPLCVSTSGKKVLQAPLCVFTSGTNFLQAPLCVSTGGKKGFTGAIMCFQ